MSSITATIKVFSDAEDITSIFSVIKQLELKSFDIKFKRSRRFTVNPNEIFIFQVDDIESKLIDKIYDIKDEIENKIIFVTKGDKALLVSSLAKLGFANIFVFPYELYKFSYFLEEIISNNSFITVKPTNGVLKNSASKLLLGKSEAFNKVMQLANKVAEKRDVNVLLLGETGTGKGLLAKLIHEKSSEINHPFVDIVCTSIPDTLLESELFGFEPGAFTSAKNQKLGLFEVAENGTLFLDEIGDLSVNIQTKLLRTIEKKVIRRLGGIVDIPIDARIISATNRNLERMIIEKTFRRDLFHRLNVVSIELPPLRYRGDDILLLANRFIEEYSLLFNKPIKKIENDVKEFLLRYTWPGNIRELKNAIERAVLLAESSNLKLTDFSNYINGKFVLRSIQKKEPKLLPQFIRLDIDYFTTKMNKLNKIFAKEVLAKTNGNKSQAAKLMGISRPKLDALLK